MKRCSLGVGCEETGVCYADAHGKPEECGRTDDEAPFAPRYRYFHTLSGTELIPLNRGGEPVQRIVMPAEWYEPFEPYGLD